MRKFGQEIIKATAGKKIHGTGAIPGGINKNLSIAERDYFLDGKAIPNVDQMIQWAEATVDFFKAYHAKNKDFIDSYATYPSSCMSLVREESIGSLL